MKYLVALACTALCILPNLAVAETADTRVMAGFEWSFGGSAKAAPSLIAESYYGESQGPQLSLVKARWTPSNPEQNQISLMGVPLRAQQQNNVSGKKVAGIGIGAVVVLVVVGAVLVGKAFDDFFDGNDDDDCNSSNSSQNSNCPS